MGKLTQFKQIPDAAYDPRLTDLSRPLRPPGRQAGAPLPITSAVVDNFRNRTVVNTTPIQLVANAGVRVLPANPRRTGLLIQNKDTTDTLFIGFGNASDTNSFQIAPGGSALFDFTCPATEIYAFATANIQAVFVDMSRGA